MECLGEPTGNGPREEQIVTDALADLERAWSWLSAAQRAQAGPALRERIAAMTAPIPAAEIHETRTAYEDAHAALTEVQRCLGLLDDADLAELGRFVIVDLLRLVRPDLIAVPIHAWDERRMPTAPADAGDGGRRMNDDSPVALLERARSHLIDGEIPSERSGWVHDECDCLSALIEKPTRGIPWGDLANRQHKIDAATRRLRRALGEEEDEG